MPKNIEKNIKKLVDSGINKIVVSLYDGPEQVEKYNNLFWCHSNSAIQTNCFSIQKGILDNLSR